MILQSRTQPRGQCGQRRGGRAIHGAERCTSSHGRCRHALGGVGLTCVCVVVVGSRWPPDRRPRADQSSLRVLTPARAGVPIRASAHALAHGDGTPGSRTSACRNRPSTTRTVTVCSTPKPGPTSLADGGGDKLAIMACAGCARALAYHVAADVGEVATDRVLKGRCFGPEPRPRLREREAQGAAATGGPFRSRLRVLTCETSWRAALELHSWAGHHDGPASARRCYPRRAATQGDCRLQ